MIDTPAFTDTYRSAGQKNFAALTKHYGTNDKRPKGQRLSFWKLGNSFDTMIDYLEVIDRGGADQIAQMADTQLKASLKDIDGGYDGAWFDDFGWWSVSTARALQKPFFNTDAKKKLQDILDQCWCRFRDNAPCVWERRTSAQYDSYGPANVGGVWNAYWDGTDDKCPGPKNGNPSDGHLIGIQNTVTNALFLMAAHRLRKTDPKAREAAKNELKFLLAWFSEPNDSLWWQIDANTGLVRERVGHFAKNVHAPHQDGDGLCIGFQEEWAWTGDQGLMLGNLSDAMLDLAPNLRGPLLARVQHLLAGMSRNLVDSAHVLQSYTKKTGCVPDFDTADYQVGSGVFWRNALYVWKTNTDVLALLKGAEFQTTLRASANAAAKPLTGKESIETLTNQTAALVAATAMLP
jgi:hypothetical protein